MAALPVVIDCDPGVDDAIALLLALASPELHVLGITTVAGNVSMDQIQRNTRQICELAGRPDLKVFAGCPRPLVQTLATAEQVHGAGGLAGVMLPEPTMPLQAQHGVDFLIETLLHSSEPITLATLGPLTNVAIALVKAPHIKPRIKEIVLMGGSTTFGNITPCAEFNIYVDPHAAHVVFTSGLPLTMIGLHVTHTVLSTPARRQRLQANGNQPSQVAAEMLGVYGTDEAQKLGLEGGPLHDPCVIAYLINPDLFHGQPAHVAIELNSPLTLGCTVVDWYTSSPNAQVILQANASGFYDLLTQRLKTIGTHQP